jgi:hypothetical protein
VNPSTTGDSPTLSFHLVDSEERLDLNEFETVIAGYTARDQDAVRHHIEELAAIGVPEPDNVPTFYPVDSALVTQQSDIAVQGGNTSGEVEPVLVRAGGDLYLAVGSDHTDRDVERQSVALSKAACPKPLGTTLVPLGNGTPRFDWDSVSALSYVDGEPYQEGTLGALRAPADILQKYADVVGDEGRDLVLFLGTFPLKTGQFVAGSKWEVSLVVDNATSLAHAYTVTRSA